MSTYYVKMCSKASQMFTPHFDKLTPLILRFPLLIEHSNMKSFRKPQHIKAICRRRAASASPEPLSLCCSSAQPMTDCYGWWIVAPDVCFR